VLRTIGTTDVGPVAVPTAWYLDREVHELEVERIWKRTWQMACREEDIPSAGDTSVYDIVGISLVIVRGDDNRIRAFYNSCLHRGRQLRDFAGRVEQLRCPYHGFTWKLDGTLAFVPCAEEFPQVRDAEFRLPQVAVAMWAGFVFVNLDTNAPPLEQFLGDLVSQFERWPLAERYKSAHVAKVVPVNWKLAQEAFMESFHAPATHPQLLRSTGDISSQYDAFDNFSRALTPFAAPSPVLRDEPTPQEILDASLYLWDDEDRVLQIPEDMHPRALLADIGRAMHRPALGTKVDRLCDAELVDAIYYTLFPNLHPWGGALQLTYRFRPFEDDHTRSILEVMLLSPYKGERPPAVPLRWLDEDQPWTDARELLMLGGVLQQDTYNMRHMQRGVRNNQRKVLVLSEYQELKIRHWYELYRVHMGVS
jgi:nitrite reductase/ring-hydroxylating ferredoxin subunit